MNLKVPILILIFAICACGCCEYYRTVTVTDKFTVNGTEVEYMGGNTPIVTEYTDYYLETDQGTMECTKEVYDKALVGCRCVLGFSGFGEAISIG